MTGPPFTFADPEPGFCSWCDAACERGPSGSWWHVSAACTPPWTAVVRFLPRLVEQHELWCPDRVAPTDVEP